MNDRKIAFIIATNNEQYFSECSYYINRLSVPEGFETDIITVRDANSICEAYNAAMHSSDALYKVYLHHDVFILNTEFINDVVNAFAMDPDVGMLGVIGAQNLPPDAYAINSWDTGGTMLFNGMNGGITMYSNEEGLNYVSAIDGMMMITCHDIEWREDIFTGWDFYDLSQSMEFWSAGYKIAVPYQKTPWCMHDLAHLGLGKYDLYRKVFCSCYHEEYGFDAGTDISNPFQDQENQNAEYAHEIVKLIWRDLENERFEEVVRKLEYVKIFRAVQDNDLEMIRELMTIHGEETMDGIHCFWKSGSSYDEIRERYISLRFLLYRAQFDCPIEDYIPILREGFENGVISSAAIRVAASKYIYDQTKVMRILIREGIPAGKAERYPAFVCPLCGNKQKVLTFNNTNRKLRKQHGFEWCEAAYTWEEPTEVYCGSCGASAEERAIVRIMQRIISGENLRVTSLSYLPALGKWIQTRDQIADYITSEREFTGQQQEDEYHEFFTLEDSGCDIVIASEVLNQCEDDVMMMKELSRLLKANGHLILVNSMGLGITDTLDDMSIDAEERILHWQIFGGEKKRRHYAEKEFINRLIDVGLIVGRVDRNLLGKEIYDELALPREAVAYICTKSSESSVGSIERSFVLDASKKVSVVLLNDGRSEALRNTIEDIREQIYPIREILICAYQLNDEEKKVISDFAEEDIKIIELADAKKNVRRNAGIEGADGEYLLFAEAGNRFDKNFIYKTVKLLSMNENYAYAYADTRLSENKLGVDAICPEEDRNKLDTSGDCFDNMLLATYPNLSAVVIRRGNIESTGEFDEALGNRGEREFLLRTLYGKSAGEVPQILVTVEMDRTDLHKYTHDNVMELLRIVDEFKLKDVKPNAYVINISGAIAEVEGYDGDDRIEIVNNIYQLVKNDRFFDATDMETIRNELGIGVV